MFHLLWKKKKKKVFCFLFVCLFSFLYSCATFVICCVPQLGTSCPVASWHVSLVCESQWKSIWYILRKVKQRLKFKQKHMKYRSRSGHNILIDLLLPIFGNCAWVALDGLKSEKNYDQSFMNLEMVVYFKKKIENDIEQTTTYCLGCPIFFWVQLLNQKVLIWELQRGSVSSLTTLPWFL